MKRIFVTGISQESNSFNPLMSSYQDFALTKGEALRNMPGVKTLIDKGYEVVESVWARAVPGGTLQFEDFMQIVDEMLVPLVADKIGFDGVFLPMHGALDVEFIGSGEAYIATKIREYVGPNVPIATALDMHGNNMYTLASACNIMYGYRTAPHVDVPETYERTVAFLIKAMEENVLPQTKVLRIPLLMPGENFMTASGLGKEVIEMLPKIEKQVDVWCASYFVGMTWIDCPQNGAAVILSGIGEMEAGLAEAKKLATFVWENRDAFSYQGLAMEPKESIDFVGKHQGDGLIVLSDSADNITAGGAGDNGYVLELFLQHGLKNVLFSSIVDPFVVAKCSDYQVGDTVDVSVGRAFDKNSVEVTLKGAVIKAMTLESHEENPLLLALDKPRSVVLSYQGIDILVFDKRKPVFSEKTLNEHGLSRFDYDVLVVKQGYLEPEFNEAASHQAMLYTTGNVDQRVERLPFKKLRRPMYPLDKAEDIPTSRLFEHN